MAEREKASVNHPDAVVVEIFDVDLSNVGDVAVGVRGCEGRPPQPEDKERLGEVDADLFKKAKILPAKSTQWP